MNREILRFVDSIHRDRQVDKEIIFVGIEQALISAAQKKYGGPEDVEVIVKIDRESGEIDATIEGEPMSPADLGRIAALSGKQVLLQKIREAEREVIHAEYEPKIGQMMTGTIQSRKPGGVLVVSLGKVEGIIPRSEQSPAENFNEGDRIKFVLAEVNLQSNRVQLICSRAHPELVRRLFELEIPEVADGVVEVKAISREAGHRTKIAVATTDPNVDCVGACVGVKGSRIRNIVDELFGEKIDIVRWNEAIELLIVEALRPAEIASLELDFETQSAIVYVKPEHQSLAIGRRGQNVRLASKLTDWDLDITPISEEELEQMRIEDMASRADGLFTDQLARIEEQEAEAQPDEGKFDQLLTAAAESGGEEEPTEEHVAAEEQENSGAFDEALRVAMAEATDEPTPSQVADQLFGDVAPADGTEAVQTEETQAPVEETASEAAPSDGATEVEVTVPAPSGMDETSSSNGSEAFNLESLPGIGKVSSERLRSAGLESREKILAAGVDELAAVEGIGEARARQIIEFLEQ